MPTMKLVSKTRVGSKEIKKHDRPQSPYKRLMNCAALSEDVKAGLKKNRALYNPVTLQHNVNRAVSALFRTVRYNACNIDSGEEADKV